MSLFYELHGTRHEISRDEVDAIERSGPPQSYKDYAANSSEWNDESWAALQCLHDRPGAVEPESRPAENKKKSHFPLDPEVARSWALLHLRNSNEDRRAACGLHASIDNILGHKAFGAALTGTRACPRCAIAYAGRLGELLNDRAPRRRPDMVKVMRWTNDELKRLKRWRKGEPDVGKGGGTVNNTLHGYAKMSAYTGDNGR